ncbi:hypothetical protein F5J12DRAFT_782836 [Pisolithus orientalis]|uniref:uncharacterized protein n=1 Tax=Pisolithus orientalis TaxID=936130 RepID=UPI002224E196|nr:uncharacterized protein F5J12DRAFT_782836 [Pisolithus orientalis]KAI6006571.1 hypothetical protein F5J12DRAFT_782836 [Pisolithus orientalis]
MKDRGHRCKGVLALWRKICRKGMRGLCGEAKVGGDMTAEFQTDICQVDVDMEFWDDDWWELQRFDRHGTLIGVDFGNGRILVLASLFQPQGVYHSLHLLWSLNADCPWSEVIELQQKGSRDPAGDVNKDGLCLAMHLVFSLPLPTTMQAYSINDMCPMFSMRDQATTVLTAALGHVWDLIKVVPQPEESLGTIYAWVEDWDKTWASIHSWWRYVNDNGISILKVHDKCMCNYTEESAMCQNLLVLGAIAIADLQCPVEQRWIHIDDIFEDYQERVELRVQLEAERLTREPSMHMHRQAAMVIGEGQGCMPSDTGAGESSRETGGQVRQQMDSTGKGKGKEKATDEVDKLENDEGNCPPNPDPLKLALQHLKPTFHVGSRPSGSAAGHSEWVGSTRTLVVERQLLGHCTNRPTTPAPQPHPEPTPPPMDNLGDLGNGGLFGRLTGLLDNPPTPNVSVQDLSKVPPVEETLLVTNLSKLTTHKALAEVDNKEFELTQIHQMLGLLIGTVQGRHEELKRLKDQLKDM